jgi:hypothetical protein
MVRGGEAASQNLAQLFLTVGSASVAGRRFKTFLLGIFSVAVLLLGAIGIYESWQTALSNRRARLAFVWHWARRCVTSCV